MLKCILFVYINYSRILEKPGAFQSLLEGEKIVEIV